MHFYFERDHKDKLVILQYYPMIIISYKPNMLIILMIYEWLVKKNILINTNIIKCLKIIDHIFLFFYRLIIITVYMFVLLICLRFVNMFTILSPFPTIKLMIMWKLEQFFDKIIYWC